MTGLAGLVPWFDAHARDLPWRRAGVSAWGVLVSEVMLQQTPVERVVPVWSRWLRQWPRPSDLAAETPGAVLRAWGKLGYPRRALRLHAAAQALATEHRDAVPDDLDTLLRLPGVGAYTARAVAAFGYGRRVPVVDTNVRRVLARAVHGRAKPAATSPTRDLADAEALLPGEGQAARFSAALMELGALVCTPRSPRCGRCPAADGCAWLRAGRPAGDTPARPAQRFAGTDRQVRGRLLDVLRDRPGPAPRAQLDLAWPDSGQRERCLRALVDEGFVVRAAGGCFALPGETGSEGVVRELHSRGISAPSKPSTV